MSRLDDPLLMQKKAPVSRFAAAALFCLSTLALFGAYEPSKTSYHSLFLTLSNNYTASRHLLRLTSRPHVAASLANSAAARYVASSLSSSSLRAHITAYDVLLSYPFRRSLVLSPPEGPAIAFNLTQEVYRGDPYAAQARDVTPTFHAYAKSGTASGRLVYANYGRAEDFAVLRRLGVEVAGAVVLARYGQIYRGDIVRNAAEAGAVGVVVYTDLPDYGGGKDGKGFPEDRWMPPTGVQVGTLYRGTGDPTTPGWASRRGCERRPAAEAEQQELIPSIPSLPVSYAEGSLLQRSIGGPTAEDGWQGGDGSWVFRLGPGPGFVNLTFEGKQEIVTIENVFGVIEGEAEPDRYILLGNHRDAWTFGAVDPNSGTAALLELAERLQKLQKRGWRPRRTIILCNWDAEEYGLIGSTEWVEDNRGMLASKVVAYLNADSAVSGAGFHAAATPQLDDLLREAAKYVKDPESSSQSLYQSWVGSDISTKIGRLGGGGSDYAAFLQHVGIPSADVRFGRGYPVYHSLYDDFVWMKKFGDPLFQRHVAVASVWGLVALRLADDEILPFDYASYALEIQAGVDELKDTLPSRTISLTPLLKAIKDLNNAAKKINLEKKLLQTHNSLSKWRKNPMKVRELNDRLMMAERAFTNPEGLVKRSWYKHMIYGPSDRNDYGSKNFPGIDDAIETAKHLNTTESWESVQREVWRVARAVTQASLVLNGRLT